mgnify:CR=1 FL=1
MKIKTMFKAILSLAVCLTTMLVISVTVSAAEYEEIKMDVEYRSKMLLHIPQMKSLTNLIHLTKVQ